MQFLKSTVADFQLRSRISRAITETTSNHRLSLKAAECEPVIALAHEHPKLVLHYLHERLSVGSGHTAAYLGILLLDILVNSCSYSFHEVLAGEDGLQKRLVALASERAESDSQRKVRSAARNVVLDFSRTFFDDPRLVALSLLAEHVEKRTGKKLLRSIQVERANVHIIDPRPEDIILISPIRRGPTGRPIVDNPSSTILVNARASKDTAPGAASVEATGSTFWVCETCTFVNNKANERCNACGTKKPLLDCVPISSPTTQHPPSHHLYQGNVHPPSPCTSPAPADASDDATAASEGSAASAGETVDVDAEAEAKRVAEAEAEAKRVAEAEAEAAEAEAEAKRVAEAEAEAKRVAEAEAEAKRVAEAEAEAKRIAEAEADAKRVAEAEAEAKRVAEAEAEAKRVAEAEAEAKRVAEAEAEAEAEAKRVAEAEAEAEAEAKRVAEAEAEAEAEAKRVAESEAEAKRVAEVMEENDATEVSGEVASIEVEHVEPQDGVARHSPFAERDEGTSGGEEEDDASSERVAEHVDPTTDSNTVAPQPDQHQKRKSRKKGGK